MTSTELVDFRNVLLAAIPRLRGYARALCRRQHLADDLVQETLLKAWECRRELRSLASMKPWLFTILRNAYFATRVRSQREIEDVDGVYALRLSAPARQTDNMDVDHIMRALDALQAQFREALLLVCVEGLSYAEAASICGCSVGTIKSRVSRGRQSLIKALDLPEAAREELLLRFAA